MCGVTNILEPNGQNTYRQFQTSNSAILPKSCIYVCVANDSHNKQTLFHYIQHSQFCLVESRCVLCEVRSEYLCFKKITFSFYGRLVVRLSADTNKYFTFRFGAVVSFLEPLWYICVIHNTNNNVGWNSYFQPSFLIPDQSMWDFQWMN